VGEGVGEHFGKGITNADGHDVFMTAMNDALGSRATVVRSQMRGGERALLAFTPAEGEIGIGLDIGGTSIRSAALNATGIQGEIARDGWTFLAEPTENREYILQTITEHILRILRAPEHANSPITTVGISWAGPGRYDEGRTWSPNIPGLDSVDRMVQIVEELETRLAREGYQLAIDVMHDGAASAIGEYRSGALQGTGGVYVILGTGIGAGIVAVDGLPVYRVAGQVGWGLGEIGHHLVYDTQTHAYSYRPGPDGEFPAITDNEQFFEDRNAGPGLAVRFGEHLLSEMTAITVSAVRQARMQGSTLWHTIVRVWHAWKFSK